MARRQTPDEGRQAPRANGLFRDRVHGGLAKMTVEQRFRIAVEQDHIGADPRSIGQPHTGRGIALCLDLLNLGTKAKPCAARLRQSMQGAASLCIPPSTAQTPRASECQMSPRIAGLR
jgi:hypothetical protein